MKYKVDWYSPKQGPRSTEVEAISSYAAKEQVDSMFGEIEGYKSYSVVAVFEEKSQNNNLSENYNSHTPSSSDSDDFSATITGVGFLVAGIAILWGLFTLPTGIGAMLLGGAIGWLSWKLGCWLSDHGW